MAGGCSFMNATFFRLALRLNPWDHHSDPRDLDHVDLKPPTKMSASPHSMSSIVGTDAQPMHTDGAYEKVPPRFIALYCIDPGETQCPTIIWRLDRSLLVRDRPSVLCKPNWIVTGRMNFYASSWKS